MRKLLASERGSAGVSTAIVVVAFLMLLGLGVAGMRTFTGASDLQSAAQAAARAAALEHEPGNASASANSVALAELARSGAACESPIVAVDTGSFEPGGTVTVNLECTVSYAGLYVPFTSGSRQVRATATEPIDCLRGGGNTEIDDNCYYGG